MTPADWPGPALRPPCAARRSCCVRWLMIDRTMVAAVTRELGRSWDTVHDRPR